ncbi:MAG: hypothetical protein J4F31_12170 [Flavobacteriales bacterium]|nr:hypothetical protein [Flavobacteriales bacterium]
MWMLHRSRLSALLLLLFSLIILFILPIDEVDPNMVAFVICLFATIIVAFALSELFHRISIDQMKYKYTISGVFGIVVGIIVYFSLRDSSFFSLHWVNVYGKDTMLILNLITALYIFFYKGKRSEA